MKNANSNMNTNGNENKKQRNGLKGLVVGLLLALGLSVSGNIYQSLTAPHAAEIIDSIDLPAGRIEIEKLDDGRIILHT